MISLTISSHRRLSRLKTQKTTTSRHRGFCQLYTWVHDRHYQQCIGKGRQQGIMALDPPIFARKTTQRSTVKLSKIFIIYCHKLLYQYMQAPHGKSWSWRWIGPSRAKSWPIHDLAKHVTKMWPISLIVNIRQFSIFYDQRLSNVTKITNLSLCMTKF